MNGIAGLVEDMESSLFEGVPLLEHQDEISGGNFCKNVKQEDIWKGKNAAAKKETAAKLAIMCLAIFMWVGLWVFVFDPFGGGVGEEFAWKRSIPNDDGHEGDVPQQQIVATSNEESVPSDDRYAAFEDDAQHQQIMATTHEESALPSPPFEEEVLPHNSFHTSDTQKAGILAHQRNIVASAGDTPRDPSNAWDLQIEYAVKAKSVEKLVEAGDENIMISFTSSSQQLPNCASFRPVWHDFAHRAHHQSAHLNINNLVVAEIDCAVTQCLDSGLELPYYAWYHQGQQTSVSLFGPQTTVQGLLDESVIMIALEKEHVEVDHDNFASDDSDDDENVASNHIVRDGKLETTAPAGDEQQTTDLEEALSKAIHRVDEAEEEAIQANQVMLKHHLQKAQLSVTLELGSLFAHDDGQIVDVDVETMAQIVSWRLEVELQEELRERADSIGDKKAEGLEDFVEELEDEGREAETTSPHNLMSYAQSYVSELKVEIDDAAMDITTKTLGQKRMNIMMMTVANRHLGGRVLEIGEDGKLRKLKEDVLKIWQKSRSKRKRRSWRKRTCIELEEGLQGRCSRRQPRGLSHVVLEPTVLEPGNRIVYASSVSSLLGCASLGSAY